MTRLLRFAAILLPLALVGVLFGSDLLEGLTATGDEHELVDDRIEEAGLTGEGSAEGATVQGAPSLAGREDAAQELARREAARRQAQAEAATSPRTVTGVPFEGRVLDPGGRPQEGVRIQARRKDGELITLETDANGRFTTALPPGVYSLLLTAPGVGARFIPRFRVDGSREEAIDLQLREVGVLAVGIDSLGEPVSGASVTVTATGIEVASDLTQTSVTGSDGIARFEDLPRTNYDVVATFPSGLVAERRIGVYGERTLQIAVSGEVPLTGQVTDGEGGRPVQGAIVRLKMRGRGRSGGVVFETETETDYEGRYSITAPRAGVQSLLVEAEGFATWPNLAAGVERRQMQQALQGLARGRPVAHNVALRRGAAVAGIASDEDGAPIPGVRIRAVLRRVGEWFATTDENGLYAFPDLNPGTYDLYPASPGWFPEGRLRVVVPGPPYNEPVPYDITLSAARTVDGLVLGMDGKPAHGARVWVTGGQGTTTAARRGGRALEAWTDAKGRWSMDDVPLKPVSFRASHGAAVSLPVSIPESEVPGGLVKLELLGTGSVRLRLVDDRARTPVRNMEVRLTPQGAPSGRTARRVRTNNGGQVTLGTLIPGSYRLEIPRTSPNFRPFEPRDIQVAAADTPEELELGLDPGYVFAGRVTDENGVPLRGARVRIQWQTREGRTQTRDTPSTDAQGRFRITGFEAGVFTLRARRGGYIAATQEGLRGGETNLEFRLTARTPR